MSRWCKLRLASHGSVCSHESLNVKEELALEVMILITTVEALPVKEA